MKKLFASLAFFAMMSFGRQTANYDNRESVIASDTTKNPTVFLEETVIQPMAVLFIRDTAAMASLSTVLAKDYAEISAFINENGLQPGKPMAFYHSYTDPVYLEVAVQVDRLPSALKGRIKTRVVDGGPALVAHYRGPYEKMEIPYSAISRWLKDNTKQGKGLPFEIYLNDPMAVTDKYELKTDILQLLY